MSSHEALEQTPDEDAFVGQTVDGRFHVLERIAAGGMGVVYKAEQIPLGRAIALKILEPSKVEDGTFARRFFLEASAAARLAHPNTIVVHDYGRSDDGVFYIAMEYLEGETLQDHLGRGGPMAPPDAVHVALQVASSLRDAHGQGLVHRDLKPGNVMFVPRGGDPLFVKVLDFGLVKVVSGDEKADLGLTRSGVMMGSPHYMAPEQVKAASVDARTDVYSFGAMMHHVLTGVPPFPADTPFEAMTAHVYGQIPRVRDSWPACPAPPDLEELVFRCLQKDPADRPQTMDDLMVVLQGLRATLGGPTGAYAGGPKGGAYSVGTNPSGAVSQPRVAESGLRASAAGAPAVATPLQTGPAPFASMADSAEVSGQAVGGAPRSRTVLLSERPEAQAPAFTDTRMSSAASGGGRTILFVVAGLLVLLIPGCGGGGWRLCAERDGGGRPRPSSRPPSRRRSRPGRRRQKRGRSPRRSPRSRRPSSPSW